MVRASATKRKLLGGSGSAGTPSQSFTPINAREPPAKRRRSARGSKDDNNVEVQANNGDEEFEEDENSVRLERTLFSSIKDTRIKSSGRSEINFMDTREPARHRLTTGEVPARLRDSLARLERATTRFCAKEITQADLDAAQAAFDLDKLCGTHVDKVNDAAALKSPWKPVVSSTEELSASLSSAITSYYSASLQLFYCAKVTSAC
ncbi:hypothetical protein ACEPPN_010380 [Leptodophora sp. 'Broadleaf-Isolate-01']